MPPCLDVYAWTVRRDEGTIGRFMEAFIDLEATRCSLVDSLTVLPVGQKEHQDGLPVEDWDEVAILSLDDAIAFGLATPPRAFTLYLRSKPTWCGALLTFTVEGGLIVGVSVDDPLSDPGRLRDADLLMSQLLEMTAARRAWVVCEEPPPLAPGSAQPWEAALALAP
jgi:hypothetical protein